MRTIVLIALLPLLAGCGKADEAPPSRPVRAGGGRIYGDAQRGKADFERWCAPCHGAGSDSAPALASLKKNPENTAASVRGFLMAPHAPMPPLALTNQEIEDLIAYLLGSE